MAKSILNRILNKLNRENRNTPIWTKIIIGWFALAVMGLITATVILFPILLIRGTVKPSDIILLIGTLLGIGALGGIFDIASLGYDENKNGIPDRLEKMEKRDKNV